MIIHYFLVTVINLYGRRLRAGGDIMKYLIGIDAGGSKSELKTYDLSGRILSEIAGGAGNPAINLENTIHNVVSLINKCTSKLGKECMLISIGMASVETGNYAELIKKYVEDSCKIETLVFNDGEMACKAYFQEDDGILAIAGTGSSCYVQKNGQGEMVGGWGHILGDEGSGYHIVIELFKEIIYNIDKNIELDNLSVRALRKIGGSSRSEIMNFIYNNEKDTIAALFPIIAHCGENGDNHAETLLNTAGKSLAELTSTAYKKMRFKGHITIGIKGGVFHNSIVIRKSYINELKKQLKSFSIIEKDISATRAVLHLYSNKRL